jgi:transcription initiation factor IIE alpha subunit
MSAPMEKPIQEMTDREIAEETLYWIRSSGKALAEIQRTGIAGLMKSMVGGMGKAAR